MDYLAAESLAYKTISLNSIGSVVSKILTVKQKSYYFI